MAAITDTDRGQEGLKITRRQAIALEATALATLLFGNSALSLLRAWPSWASGAPGGPDARDNLVPLNEITTLPQDQVVEFVTATRENGKLDFTGANVDQALETGLAAFLCPSDRYSQYRVKPGIDRALSQAASNALDFDLFTISDRFQLGILESIKDSVPEGGNTRVLSTSKHLVVTERSEKAWTTRISLPWASLPLPNSLNGSTPIDSEKSPYQVGRDRKGDFVLIYQVGRTVGGEMQETGKAGLRINASSGALTPLTIK